MYFSILPNDLIQRKSFDSSEIRSSILNLIILCISYSTWSNTETLNSDLFRAFSIAKRFIRCAIVSFCFNFLFLRYFLFPIFRLFLSWTANNVSLWISLLGSSLLVVMDTFDGGKRHGRNIWNNSRMNNRSAED